MIRVALKGLAGRKLRAFLTALAIVLGVAMISGTYVLTDTIESAFTTVFSTVYKNTDAIVLGNSAVGRNTNNPALPPSFPASLLGKIRKLPGVALAQGSLEDYAYLVGRNGKIVSSPTGLPLAFGVHSTGNLRFDAFTLASGRLPVGPHEVDIDTNTAAKEHYTVGDTIGVVARGAERKYRIAGIGQIAGVSFGGATIAIFDFPTAEKLFHKEGELDQISIAARQGTTPQQLVQEIKPLLGRDEVVRTGEEQTKQAQKDVGGFVSIIRDFLLAFGGVSLFVGTFVIANTLSITITQRTRELATLRTLGATRRQVRQSILAEALVIGALGSVAGLFAGLGLAKVLNKLFVAFGVDLPQAGTVFATRTIVVSLAVGMAVTVAAAMRPAIRATRVPPIAAVREGAVLPESRFARFSVATALITIGAALAIMLLGLLVHGLKTADRLIAIGIGAAAVFLGVAMLTKTLVPPLARALGWPGVRLGGSAGILARANATRNPQRTASTAAALMIGLALVTLVSVLVAGLKAHFEGSVNSLFQADYALTATNNFTPIPVAPERALARVPGVTIVSGVRAAPEASAWGGRIDLTGVSGDISSVIDAQWDDGSQATPGQLGRNGAIVAEAEAQSHDLKVGSPLVVETPTGSKLHLVVVGIYAPPKGAAVFGDVAISTKRFDAAYPNPEDLFAFVDMDGGVTPANTARLTNALKPFPEAKIATESEFKHNQELGLDRLLNLLYILLSLSVVISLVGIVNTLVLTVFERTRELGMLRAVGMTRRQVRAMIFGESIVTALIGAALALPLGILLAAMVGDAISYTAFTLPWGQLVVFVIAAVIVGILAAIFPARRAAKLNVLEALQYE